MRVKKRLSIIPEKSGTDGNRAAAGKEPGMQKFEDLGRKLDRELERLRDIAEEKLGPEKRGKAAKALRSISERLANLAAELESKPGPKAQ